MERRASNIEPGFVVCEMDVRPHPGPLPQERESRRPRLASFDALESIRFVRAGIKKAVTATLTVKFSRGFDSLSLSRGERAGVRAGVTSKPFR
jgi:hypothetical protein